MWGVKRNQFGPEPADPNEPPERSTRILGVLILLVLVSVPLILILSSSGSGSSGGWVVYAILEACVFALVGTLTWRAARNRKQRLARYRKLGKKGKRATKPPDTDGE